MQNGKEVSRRHVKLFEPHLRKGDEEELLRSELGQPRKPGLGSKLLHGVDVGPEWLVKSSVVGDVLSLSEDSIQLKRNRINKVSSWRNKYKLNCFFSTCRCWAQNEGSLKSSLFNLKTRVASIPRYPITLSGYSITLSGYSISLSGYSISLSGYSMTLSGYHITLSGYSMTLSEYSMTLSGYCVTVSWFSKTLSGYYITLSGYSITMSGYSTTGIEWNSFSPQKLASP